MKKNVNKCVCHKRTFTELKEISEQNGYATCNELFAAGLCGGNCSMCKPYIEKTFVPGETEFFPGDVYFKKKVN